jgi:hypothetical protein
MGWNAAPRPVKHSGLDWVGEGSLQGLLLRLTRSSLDWGGLFRI